ncbi:hypothetical protein SISSUDRAFT_1024433 [Sistotremastrum suecicum HHB10207 ss-3]|uniref:Uncharacterized protein n=1 Tax=Sistotremastrum suecicum HHB10207 ss-3 TaxID=1314776 RepID=A0A166BEH2_9AGAM|nr:hypothetical protein SISSUDRAFT_1024433 [Sistotremastrum suecicum HHB10207 ss-3]
MFRLTGRLSRAASTPVASTRRGIASTSSLRNQSQSQAAVQEQGISRPLYYHLLQPAKQAWAVSFLPEPPKTPESPTILGYLPAKPASEEADSDALELNDFRENPAFMSLLHRTIQKALRDGVDETLKAEAIQRGEGWLHINGTSSKSPQMMPRNVPALGRINDPEDIVASVMVEDGKILPDTYQVMPTYRLITTDGPIRLPHGLDERLSETLEQLQTGDSGAAWDHKE